MMALKALVDPKKMRPNKMTMTDVKIKAFRGSPNLGWTLAKKREAGKPPSRANAKIIRLPVVITLRVANTRHSKGNIRRQMAPALLLVA